MKKLILLLMLLSPTAHAYENLELELNLGAYALGMFGITQLKEEDKKSHAFAGGVCGTWGTILAKDKLGGIICAGVAGALKEGYDRRTEGHVADWADFFYTLGSGIYFSYLTENIIEHYEGKRRRTLMGLTNNKYSNIVLYNNYEHKPMLGYHRSWR